MFWQRRRTTSYQRPSGRTTGRRFEGSGGGLFKKRQYFWQRRSFKVYAILAGLGVAFILYLLFWSGLFKIQNIQINGATSLDPAPIEQIVRAQMQKSRFLVFSQSNLLFFDATAAENAVKNQFVINDIQIKKRPFKTLKIELSEKTSQITFVSNDRYYYLDPNGIAVKEILVAKVTLVEGEAGSANASTTPPAADENLIDLGAIDQGLPLVYDLSNKDVKIGQKIIEPQMISFIIALRDKLPGQQIGIKSFQIPERQGTEVRVVTDKGYDIYFSSKDDLARQLANLNLVLKEKVKDKKINYIDLKFGNRVFIK